MKNKENIQVAVIAAIIVFGIYFLLQQGTTVFKAEVVGTESVHTDTLNLPKSSLIAQSLFDGLEDYNYTLPKTLQSSVPLTDTDSKITFTTTVENPFEQLMYVKQLVIYQNDVADSRQILNVEIQPGLSNVFRTTIANLETTKNQANTIKLDFLIELEDETVLSEVFEYNYYVLDVCKSTSDCATGTVCDLENIARFSDGTEFYCVSNCGSNNDCAEGQLCIKGRCGY